MTPEYIIEICVAIDIAILGIAYPIIVNKISNIGDKYSSQYIPVIFSTEFPQKSLTFLLFKREYSISVFKLTLYTTFISLFFLIFKFEPPFGWNNWFINNSAKYLVLTLSTTLTIFFFLWLDKVVLYNGKSKSILTHLINQFYSINKETETKQYHLKAINELTFYAIEKQDEHLQETILNFYYNVFSKIRQNHNKDEPLIYPIDLYFLVNKLNIESISIDNKKLRAIEDRAVSGNWLLGQDFEDIEISEETYNWLWRNLYIICDNSRLVKMFWSNSSQYFDFRLNAIYADYDFEKDKVVNQDKINRREQERNKFLEFHYALGGLLLYRRQYGLLNYLFQHSQSQPPKYVLLPKTMKEIFIWFEYFSNEFKNRQTPIFFKYSFPELDNLSDKMKIKYWICSYITILFIRQYSLLQYNIDQNFTDLPILPDDVLELSNWLDSASFFEKCLNDILNNQEAINELDYEKIIESKKEEFHSYVKRLKKAIQDKMGQQKLNAVLSPEKIKQFLLKSNEIISTAFKDYDSVFVDINNKFTKSKLKLNINGAIALMSKFAFIDDDIPDLNYDTVFASSIVTNNIKRLIPNSFEVSRTKHYLLNKDNILLALKKIVGNNTDIIIIGVRISNQLKMIIDNSNFKKFINYIPSTEPQFQDVLFILRKDDLPAIEHREIKEKEKNELQLILINNELKIYSSVIDINIEENKKIKDKWNLENEPGNLDLKVQLAISFSSIIYWKNDREIIQISIASKFKEQGIQNDINDVEPLQNSEDN